MLSNHVILVDVNDCEQGTMDKVEAHLKGELHRAFSIFILNSKNELLLQKRSELKYHSKGKWSNSCCSHPRPFESLETAVHRRLREELGFDCDLKFKFSFHYKTELENDLIEHEIDHVYVGYSDSIPVIDMEEVSVWRYASIASISDELENNSADYSVWFPIAFNALRKYL